MRILNDLLIDAQTVALSYTSAAQDTQHMVIADLTAVITAANPSNKTFVDADVSVANDTITFGAAHGFTTGMKFQLTTTGVLPGGLATATDYYAIVTSTTVIKVATSQSNATAGTAVNITSAAGGGTHTVAVTATIAGTVKLQKTLDPPSITQTWTDIPSVTTYAANSQSFSGTTNLNWIYGNGSLDVTWPYIRAVVAATSGTVVVSLRINAKGN